MGRVIRLGDPLTVGLTRLGQTLVLEERPTAALRARGDVECGKRAAPRSPAEGEMRVCCVLSYCR